jgi:hypothetical protein
MLVAGMIGTNMKTKPKKNAHHPTANKLCTSCRRTCKQAANAVVAKCPRYYPFNRTQTKREFTWKQMELGL